jgi:beta-lactamase regulating signal transducer with metallopeptidase domain
MLSVVAIWAERTLLSLGRPCRGAWLFIAITSVVLSGALLVEAQTIGMYFPDWITERIGDQAWYAASTSNILKFVLTLGSAVFALSVALELVQANRVTRGWGHGHLDAMPVRLSEDFGPATFGFFRPEVVVPRWLLSADAQTRAAAVAHEQEHIAAYDRLMSLLGLALIIVFPWNLLLHWQVRRLRRAIELDCDARVVYRRRALDASSYALALERIYIGANPRVVPTIMSERGSYINDRIRLLIARHR